MPVQNPTSDTNNPDFQRSTSEPAGGNDTPESEQEQANLLNEPIVKREFD